MNIKLTFILMALFWPVGSHAYMLEVGQQYQSEIEVCFEKKHALKFAKILQLGKNDRSQIEKNYISLMYASGVSVR